MNTKVQQALIDKLMEKSFAVLPTIQSVNQEVLLTNIGRGNMITAFWLGLITGHPSFYLGPTGVNKTGTIEAITSRIENIRYWSDLIPKLQSSKDFLVDSTAILEEEIEGGKRITVEEFLGRASGAEIVFADEFFKREDHPALNDLIDFLLSGQIRHQGKWKKTPLMQFIAAGNEVADSEGDLGAVWSRMTIRLQIQPLDWNQRFSMDSAREERYQSARWQKILDMLGEQTKARTEEVITMVPMDQVLLLRNAWPFIQRPDSIRDVVQEIFTALLDRSDSDFSYLVSKDDRRYGRVADVLKAHALLNGRDTVATEDLRVLEWMLWDTPEQIPVLNEVLAEYIRTSVSEAQELVNALLSPTGAIEAAKTGDINQGVSALSQLQTATAELDRLIGEASSDVDRQAIRELKQKVSEAQNKVLAKVTGQS